MNADRLLALYEKVAEAPDAVPRLRRFVLDLAVRGKLGTQDAGDEPASELLKRIAAEKARLVKAKAIRKPKAVLPLEPDELPFPAPRGWAWTQIAELGIISPRNEASDDVQASFVPMPMIAAEYGIANGHEPRPWREIKKGYTHFAEGDVGLAKITPCFENGKSTVFRNLTSGIGAGTTELHVVRPLFVDADYIVLFLKSPQFIETGIPRMTGTAGQKRVPTEYFTSSPFPLPPLAEQRRIVAKVKELMALLDRLEAARTAREATRDRLTAASLARLTASDTGPDAEGSPDVSPRTGPGLPSGEAPEKDPADACPAEGNTGSAPGSAINQAVSGVSLRTGPGFPSDTAPKEDSFPANARFALATLPALTTRPDQIKPLRQTILNLAVRGKLVEGADGELATVGEYRKLQNGYAFKSGWFAKSGMRLLRNANIGHGEIRWDETVYLPEERVAEFERFRLQKGDIVLTLDRPFIVTGTKVARVTEADLPSLLLQRVGRFVETAEGLADDYLFLWINSPHFNDQIDPGRSNGVPHISSKQVEAAEIYVPPLTEQHRIVAKVDALMALCDRLEAALTTTDTTRARLLDALLHEALNPATAAVTEAAE